MPYITEEKRKTLDNAIHQVMDALRQIECDDPEASFEGTLNYLFTTIILKSYTLNNYDEHNRVVGLLECVKAEYYRRRVAPYEMQKCYENSDVYPTPLF